MIKLTTAIASDICMNQCRAGCCRGPIVLELTPNEVAPFEDQASRLGANLQVGRSPGGGGWVRFADYPGERCPMLDGETFACRIYQDRPQRCRDFPQKAVPGCAISSLLYGTDNK